MAFAVSGLSPVTITVRRPIFRSRSNRSRMPGLRMSSSTTRPAMLVALADQQRRRPLRGDRVHLLAAAAPAACRRCCWTCLTTASAAPLRMTRPSGRSTPLMRVWAVNSTNRDPGGGTAPRPCRRHAGGTARRCSCPRASRRRPTPAPRAGPTSAAARSPSGTNSRRLAVADRDRAGLVEQQRVDVAGHLDRLAALGDHVRPQGPVHAGDADGRQQRADRRRDQADEQRHQRRDVGAEALERSAAPR